jgi:ABC-type antimicrobial peptide transport system permease subunit
MIIGQLGGLVGIILGIIGYGIATALDFVFVIPWGAIFAAFTTSFIVALVSDCILPSRQQFLILLRLCVTNNFST